MSIISPDDLASRLGDARLRVVDLRWYLTEPDRGRVEYEAGHIPSAVFFDVETDLTGRRGPGRHPLPHPEQFCDTLRNNGIDTDHLVVAYDDSGGTIAARLWWMLRAIGHRDVRVLDGGFRSWVDGGRPVSQAVPRPKRASYPAVRSWMHVVDKTVVQDSAGSRVIIDARAAERYRGEVEPIDARAGHIPGAINLPYEGNLDDTGHMLSTDHLKARYADVGADPIVYCGSGITACHDLLALDLIGVTAAALYEGSWSDWSSDRSLPMATGPT